MENSTSSTAGSAIDSVKVSGAVADVMRSNSPLQLLQQTTDGALNSMLKAEAAKQAPMQSTVPPFSTPSSQAVTPQSPLINSQTIPTQAQEAPINQNHADTAMALLKHVDSKLTKVPPMQEAPAVTGNPGVAPVVDPMAALDDALSGTEKPTTEPANPELAPTDDALDDLPEVAPEDPEAPKDTTKENYKLARERLKIKTEKLAQANQTIESLTKEVNDFRSGATVSEELKKKDVEIQELTKYRDLFNIKMSPEYDAAYIQPLNKLGEQLEAYAETYQIPGTEMAKATQINNPADLTRYLSQLADPVAALEMKGIIGNIQQIQKEAREAELEPVQAFHALKSERERITQAQDIQRRDTISASAKESWTKAINTIQDQGNIPELTWHQTDNTHNQNVVQKFRAQAAKDFGRMIKDLTDNGVQKLPEGFAEALARTALLAVASEHAIQTRASTAQKAQALEKSTAHLNSILYPSIGGVNGTGNVMEGKAPSKPQGSIASQLLKDTGIIK